MVFIVPRIVVLVANSVHKYDTMHHRDRLLLREEGDNSLRLTQ